MVLETAIELHHKFGIKEDYAIDIAETYKKHKYVIKNPPRGLRYSFFKEPKPEELLWKKNFGLYLTKKFNFYVVGCEGVTYEEERDNNTEVDGLFDLIKKEKFDAARAINNVGCFIGEEGLDILLDLGVASGSIHIEKTESGYNFESFYNNTGIYPSSKFRGRFLEKILSTELGYESEPLRKIEKSHKINHRAQKTITTENYLTELENLLHLFISLKDLDCLLTTTTMRTTKRTMDLAISAYKEGILDIPRVIEEKEIERFKIPRLKYKDHIRKFFLGHY